MSTQIQQTQQPPLVYPNTVNRPNPSSESHSNGSFGTVFIVLAVIVVISAIACCLGRLCNRRFHGQQKPPKHSNKVRHKEREPRQRDLEFGLENRMPPAGARPVNGDLEFGLEKRMPPPGARRVNGDPEFGLDKRMPPPGARSVGFNGDLEFGFDKRFPSGRHGSNGDHRGHKPSENGEMKGEFRPADDHGEFKPSAR